MRPGILLAGADLLGYAVPRRSDAVDTIEEYSGDSARLDAVELIALGRPVVLRRLAADWPISCAADKAAYLKRFDSGTKTEVSVAAAEHEGRLFYTDGMAGLTFTKQPASVSEVLDRLERAAAEPEPETIAAQAVSVPDALPGFAEENRLALIEGLRGKAVQHRIWIGNRVVTATHHDMFSNLAVVVAGRRQFTLFPPDQVASLYLGDPCEPGRPGGTRPRGLPARRRGDAPRADRRTRARRRDLHPAHVVAPRAVPR